MKYVDILVEPLITTSCLFECTPQPTNGETEIVTSTAISLSFSNNTSITQIRDYQLLDRESNRDVVVSSGILSL